MEIAVFDFDKTLTTKHSFWRFLRYIAGNKRFLYAFFALRSSIIKFLLGKILLMELREHAIFYFFCGISFDQLDQLSDLFAKNAIPSWVNEKAMNRFIWHKSQGHRTVIISNSLELYLEKWAYPMGFHKVIGSQLEVENGKTTGRLRGKHCVGVEKVNRLRDYLEFQDKYCIYAYGDSKGDKELLQFADYSFYRSFK